MVTKMNCCCCYIISWGASAEQGSGTNYCKARKYKGVDKGGPTAKGLVPRLAVMHMPGGCWQLQHSQLLRIVSTRMLTSKPAGMHGEGSHVYMADAHVCTSSS